MASVSLAAALRRMGSLVNRERGSRPAGWDVGTGEVRALLRRLGEPQRAFRAVHVAGSKGKGSVSVRIALGLRASGLRVGLYMSPHVHALNERVCVDSAPIDDARLASALHRTLDARDAIEADARTARRPLPSAPAAGQGATHDPAGWAPGVDASWFDVLTAAAFRCFADARVDWAVVECGMGGLRDSTNALGDSSELSVLTNVYLEHSAQLGLTRVAIAAEKAAIVRRGASFVSGLPLGSDGRAPSDSAAAEALRIARARGAASVLSVARADTASVGAPGGTSVARANEALAELALRELALREPRLAAALAADAPAVLRPSAAALAALLPSRHEVLFARRGGAAVRVVVDGAHVPDSVALLVRDALAAADDGGARAKADGASASGAGAGQRARGSSPAVGSEVAGGSERVAAVVLAVGEDKDAEAIVRALAPVRGAAAAAGRGEAHWAEEPGRRGAGPATPLPLLLATSLEGGATSVPAAALAAMAREQGWGAAALAVEDPRQAVLRALDAAAGCSPPGAVLVTGSLKLGAAARAAVREWEAA